MQWSRSRNLYSTFRKCPYFRGTKQNDNFLKPKLLLKNDVVIVFLFFFVHLQFLYFTSKAKWKTIQERENLSSLGLVQVVLQQLSLTLISDLKTYYYHSIILLTQKWTPNSIEFFCGYWLVCQSPLVSVHYYYPIKHVLSIFPWIWLRIFSSGSVRAGPEGAHL